jgi:hypothetical protein
LARFLTEHGSGASRARKPHTALLFTRNPVIPRKPIVARLYLSKRLVQAQRIAIAAFE